MSTRDVVIAILARNKARYLPLYLACLESQTWPKRKTHLYIRSNDNTDDTVAIIRAWLARVGGAYASIHEDYSALDPALQTYAEHEWNPHRFEVLGAIRQESVAYARALGCHYLVVDCDNFIQPEVTERLVELIELGFPVVGPLLVTASDRYANMHVETDANGYFREGPSYEPIRSRALTGVMSVGVVHCTYMIGWDAESAASYVDGSQRHEYIVFSDAMRQAGVTQYIDNRHDYGRLCICDSEQEFTHQLRFWADMFECWKTGEPARYVAALLSQQAGHDTATYTTPLGIFTVFRNEEFVADPMRRGQAWDQGLIEMLLPALSPAEDVLDAGAHVGTHAVPYAGRARHVHAFEPQPRIHELLLENLRANDRANVSASSNALGHDRRDVCMSTHIPDGASAGTSVQYGDRPAAVNHGGIQIAIEGTPATMQTIDSLGLDALRYLKVDTEGAEPLVFWGARDTIRRQRPIIVYERSYKRIDTGVLDALQVPEHVRQFQIDVFARTLAYHDPIALEGPSYLLLPQRSAELAEQLMRSDWPEGSFHVDLEGRLWCHMPGRGDFPTGVLDAGTLCVWFTDVSYLFTGTLTPDGIAWSNGTVWERQAMAP